MPLHEIKNIPEDPSQRTKILSVGNRISEALHTHTIKSISTRTGYHPETIRRYLNAESRVSADFVASVTREYQLDANKLLLGRSHPLDDATLGAIPTDKLVKELTRRLGMIR